MQLGAVTALEPLPFREGQSPLAMASGSVAQRGAFDDGTGTVVATMAPQGKALPFSRGEPVAAMPTPVPLPIDSFESVAPASIERGRADEASASVALRPDVPAPPLMIGPLATPEMAAHRQAPMTPTIVTDAGSEPPAVPKPVPLPLDEFSLERCAGIAASMARRKTEAPRILEQSELDRAVWEALDKHWTDTIREETRRGKVADLKAYDAAYVGQLEKERGPIQVEEYARLVIANERGTASEVLADLTLPRGAVMRIERVWLDRMGEDVRLGADVNAAIETEREQSL
jgi:hypothetical protein